MPSPKKEMDSLKVGLLASGSGSTGEPLFDHVVVIITNNPGAGVVERAKKHHIPYFEMPRKNYQVLLAGGGVNEEASKLNYGESLIKVFLEYEVNFVSQNGWSVRTPENLTDKFKDHIVNSHPAPLDPGYPDFGGQGMHGLAVHEAVIQFSRMVKRPFHTEVTLHKVISDYDKGPLLAFSPVEVKEDDTQESLQARLKIVEMEQNKRFWDKVAVTMKLEEITRADRVILPGEEKLLEEAKKIALEKYPKG